MYNKKYKNFLPFKSLRRSKIPTGKRSETEVALAMGVSRTTVRRVEEGNQKVILDSLLEMSSYYSGTLVTLFSRDSATPECSVVGVSYEVMRDGFDSWKVHFFNLVDEFRKTRDGSLILLGPPAQLDLKLRALIASMVLHLCAEIQIDAPSWAEKPLFLNEPWFLSGSQSLVASALLEAPVYYRQNNIFVLENFLWRA